MIDIGTVTGEEITTNKDGDDNVRLLQVEFSNPDDLQTIEHLRIPGDDSSPQPGSRVIVVDLGPSYRVAIAFDDGIVPSAAAGNKYLYAHDDTPAKMAWINLKNDETIEIANASGSVSLAANGEVTITTPKVIVNSTADSAALASAVDTLWTTLYDLFVTNWTPVPNDGGAALKTAFIAAFPPPGPSSVASAKLKVDS